MSKSQMILTFYDRLTVSDLSEDGYRQLVEENKDVLISEFSRAVMSFDVKQKSSGKFIEDLLIVNLFVPTSHNLSRLDRSQNAIMAINVEFEKVKHVVDMLKDGEYIPKRDLIDAIRIVLSPTSLSF